MIGMTTAGIHAPIGELRDHHDEEHDAGGGRAERVQTMAGLPARSPCSRLW